MGFSLGGIVHGIEHGAGDLSRGFGNWNGPHQSGDMLEKVGRIGGALSNPEAVAGQAFHRLSNPVDTWEHGMGSTQHHIVEGAGVVGALGLGLAGGAALLGGGAAAAEGGAGAAAEGGGGMSLGARFGRGLMIHEAVKGATGGGMGGGAPGPNPYEAQAVAHQQLGALNATQFG